MKSTVAPYQTAAWCVRIVCTNGTTVRLTSYPFDLTMSNATVYKTDSGYEASAFSSSSSMAPGAIDIEGIAGVAGISRDQVASGIFDGARVYVFKCNYLSPVDDYEEVSSGFFGKTTISDDRYKIEGMSLADALGQSVGKTYKALCSHKFGDARCQIDLAAVTVTGSLTHVTGQATFRDSSRAEVADYFGAGTITFTSGANLGLKPLEIKSYAADGTITTHEPPYYLPSVGDTYSMIAGCRKRKDDCTTKWNNVTNAFAFWDIPTETAYTLIGGLTQ